MDTINLNKDVHSTFEWRDPICVSHYPFPEQSPDESKLFELLALDQENKSNQPKALYVHVPFCDSICSFCPFNKVIKDEAKIIDYLEAIKEEIRLYSTSPYFENVKLGSVYLGGGTPTSLSAEQLSDLVQYIKDNMDVNEDAQISVEGSPSNFTQEKLEALYKVGVNRVSFGVQTFNEKSCQIIELPHSAQQNLETVKTAQRIGYENICIDLLYNLPGQSMKEWEQDVQMAIDLNIDHITLFSLCLVPGTRLEAVVSRGEIPAPGNQDDEIDKFIKGREMLRAEGYIQYSVWDFAKPGKIDEHVQIYYNRQQDLIGTGPAAFGYVNKYMYINKGNLTQYIDSIKSGHLPVLVGEKASKMDQMRGMMAKGLRLYRVDKSLFKELFQLTPEEVFPEQIFKLKEKELIQVDDDFITLTDNGGVWGNNVSKEFFEKPETFEWRASLAKGRMPKEKAKDIEDNEGSDIIQWEKGIKDLFEKVLEGKPIFIRNKAREDIYKQASSLAIKRGDKFIQESDLVIATLNDTPAPYRPIAISGFRKLGVEIDNYLNKKGGLS